MIGTNETRLEIGLRKNSDAHLEAVALSKDFGSTASLVLDEVAADGSFRTNSVFRNGTIDKRVVPANLKDWTPGARRLLVRPEGTGLKAPNSVKIIQ